ncbi:MAG: head GIN domain-containing protein [Weeksellaceae bacterium]
MKNLIILCSVFMFFGCNSENGSDCFKKQGTLVSQVIETDVFSKINISQGIALTVSQAEEISVKVIYGENLIEDIRFEVMDGELKITNANGCEMMRNYHPAQVMVALPDLEKIYSSSQYSVHSEGVLTFPELLLESGIVMNTPSSAFEMEINNQVLKINDNAGSVYKIKGKTKLMDVRFWGGDGRLDAGDLQSDEITVYHRSTNDMIVFPRNKISGKLASTGNLVLKNVPPVIEIEQLFTGKVIYP